MKELDITDYISADKDGESTESENIKSVLPFKYLLLKSPKPSKTGYFVNDNGARVSFVGHETQKYKDVKSLIRQSHLGEVFLKSYTENE